MRLHLIILAMAITGAAMGQTIQGSAWLSGNTGLTAAAAVGGGGGASPFLWASTYTNIIASYGTSVATLSVVNIPANAFLVATLADDGDTGTGGSISSTPVVTWGKAAGVIAVANSGNCSIWTNRFAVGGTMTITAQRTTGGTYFSATFQVYTNVSADPVVGAIATGTVKNPGTALITISKAASTAVLVGSDWSAVAGSVVYTNTPVTETFPGTDFQSGAYRGIHIIKTNLSTGSIALGQASPTGTEYGICIVEVKGP